MMQVNLKFAIIAKIGRKRPFGCRLKLIKRGEGADHSITSYPPLPSLRRVTSAAARAPACTTALAAVVAEPCTSTVPCLTEPHHRRHDPVRTSSARTTTEPWVTATVAPAEPSLPPLAIATRPLPLPSHHCAHTVRSASLALP